MLVFLNGEFVRDEKAVVSIFDRGFLYGDGLFETIRVLNGKPFRWHEHIARLQAGADFLKIKSPYSSTRLRRIAERLVRENEMPDCLLRLTLSRGIGIAGYSPAKARKPTIVMALRAAPVLNPKNPPRWKLVTSSFRIASNDPLAHIKTLNKLSQVLARAEADAANAHEAILLNTDGYVAEGTSSNVFWVQRGAIYTPPVSAGILPGVTRAVVFEIAATLGIAIRERRIRLKDLARMDGVYVSLTSRGIVEVVSLDGKDLKRSQLTQKVRNAYAEWLKHP